MQKIKKETLQIIRDAQEAARGTKNWYKYSMCHEYKNVNGEWKVLNWIAVPVVDRAYIKTIRGSRYIYAPVSFEPLEYGRWYINETIDDILRDLQLSGKEL